MYTVKNIFLLVLLMAIPLIAFGQSSKKEANKEYEDGNYKLAVDLFNKVENLEKDKESLAKRGIANYHINNLNAALNDLSLSKKNGNDNAELLYYVAKVYQHKGSYDKAMMFYKMFINTKGKKSFDKAIIYNEIKRCAYAQQNRTQEPFGLVESFNEPVNSVRHEIYPIASANIPNKYYFSSNLAKDFDVYSTSFENDGWARNDDFSEDINTRYHEILQGLSPNGDVLFFERGRVVNGNLMFNHSASGELPEKMDETFEENDVDFQFLDQNTVIFAAVREGGFGGYDLYMRKYVNRKWTAARNLGPEINSAFDERSPFMSPDGNTLFFSSNGIKSYGGFDIYQSKKVNNWSTPENLGLPVNSAGDDLFFRITAFGTAVMASDRKTAIGGFDIYQIFMKTPIPLPEKEAEELAFIKQPKNSKTKPAKKEEEIIASERIPENQTVEKNPNQSIESKAVLTSNKEEIVKTEPKAKKDDKKEEPIKQVKEIKDEPKELVLTQKEQEDKLSIIVPPKKERPRRKPIQRTKAGSGKVAPIVKSEDIIVKETPSQQEPAKKEEGQLSIQLKERKDEVKKSPPPAQEIVKEEPVKKDVVKEEILKEEVVKEEKENKVGDLQIKTLQPMYFENSDNMMSEDNEVQLENILKILNNYPESNVVLTGHSQNKGLIEFQLYRTLLNAEKMASYLEMNGINKERIVTKSVGSNYPYVKDNAETSVKRFNQKIDVSFNGLHDSAKTFDYLLPDIRPFEKDNRFEIYHTIVDDALYYRVEINRQNKMFKNIILRNYTDLLAEKNHGDGTISYLIGLYDNFNDAKNLKLELDKTNVPFAKIVAYYNGVRLDKDAANSLVSDYPELQKYLDITND